jgi:hypothetical protein
VEVFSSDARLVNRFQGSGSNAFDFNATALFKGRLLFITKMSAADGGINLRARGAHRRLSDKVVTAPRNHANPLLQRAAVSSNRR